MKMYTEEEYINCIIYNDVIEEKKCFTDHALYDFFKNRNIYSNNPFPEEYNDIKKELLLIKSYYNRSLWLYGIHFYYFIAAVFRCLQNDGITITNKQINYFKKNITKFHTPNELLDYLVTVFLPYREDLISFIKLDNIWYRGERMYVRVGHNVMLSYEWGFINPNEKEVFDLVDNYKSNGLLSMTHFLIGFYYINHHKYNLSIDRLKDVLDNCNEFVDYMLLNGLSYENIEENAVLNFFQNSFKKMIIK